MKLIKAIHSYFMFFLKSLFRNVEIEACYDNNSKYNSITKCIHRSSIKKKEMKHQLKRTKCSKCKKKK